MKKPIASEFCQARIIQAKPLGAHYFLLTLVPAEEFAFVAGQYVRMHFVDALGSFERYYSIANAPTPENFIQFCILLNDERVKRILLPLALDEQMTISRAQGDYRIVDKNNAIVLIAGGSGISPMRAFFQELTAGWTKPPVEPLHLIYGCRSTGAMPGKEEFVDLRGRGWPKVKILLCAEDGEFRGEEVKQGAILDYLPAVFLPSAHYYVCGSPAMLQAVKSRLQEMNVKDNFIFVDPY